MRAGGFPGNPGGLASHRLHLKGYRRGAGTGSPSPRPWTWHLASDGANPQVLGWYRRAKATKRGGMGGEESERLILPVKRGNQGCRRNPVEGRGRREMDPLAGKTANTPSPSQARGDGRRGVGVSHSTAEAGELSPRDPGHRQVAPVERKTANTPRLGPDVTTTDSRTGQTSHGGGHRLASWTSGYATARSEAICRGAGCGRTRTSGSVGGQGQQRPWSTRPLNGGDPRDVIHLEQASKDRMVHRDVEDRILLPEAPWRSG